MYTTHKIFRLTALATALMTVCGAAWAEDDEVSTLIRPDSSVSLGIGNWSSDREQQGIYDDMRDGKAYGLLDAEIVKRDDATGTWFMLDARNLGLEEGREIRAEILRQGNVGVSLEYGRITRENPDTFNTGLQGLHSTFQTVSGAGGNALPLRDVTLGTERDLFNLGFYKNLMPGVDFRLSFKHEKKEGNRPWGMGSQALFLVEPIDSTTKQLEATLEYTGERLQLQGGYYGSWYDNADDMVQGHVNGAAAGTGDGQTPGSTRSPDPVPLTLPLDNQAHQVFLNGGYNFTPTTRGTIKLAYARATQDERLPTWNLAVPNNRFLGAPSSLDGEINTTTVQLGLTSQPLPKLSVLASLRYHDVDDDTPLAGFVGSNTTGAITVHNTPQSYRTNSGKVEATYQLPAEFSVTGGIDYSDQNRSHPKFEDEIYVPFRSDLDEITYRLQLRRSLSETVNGSLAYLHSRRDGSGYTTTEDTISDQINPIHLADRERDKWRLTIDWMPLEALSFQLNVEDARDDYETSSARPYGLRDGSARLYSLDASYAPNENWQLSAWASRDETKVDQFTQRSASSNAIFATKDDHLRDKGDSIGLGIRGQATAKLKIGSDLQWTRNRSKYDENLSVSGVGAYPTSGSSPNQLTIAPLTDIESRLTRLSLFSTYAINSNSDLRFDFIHERWKTNDWTWMIANGAPFTYGTTTDGTTVTADKTQTSSYLGARYIYKF